MVEIARDGIGRVARGALSTRGFLTLGALLAFAFGALAAWRGRHGATPDQWIFFTVVPWILAAAAAWLSRFRVEIRQNAVAAIVSTGLTLYMCEVLLLTIAASPQLAEMVGSRVMWSPASRLETIQELRKSDPNVFPIIPAGALLAMSFPSLGVQSLNPTVGLSTAVLCNERGPVVTYHADRYGFNNPDDQWDASAVELLVIGDSYTHGVCVEPGEGFVDHLRATWPSAINLSLQGSGPLAELAMLKEYAADARPRTVVWVYYEGNDLTDLRFENDDDVLPRYLEPGFSQHLRSRQSEIDALMRVRLDSMVADPPTEEAPAVSIASILRRAVGLRSLREMAGIYILFPTPSSAIGILPDVMSEAQRSAGAWGGRLVLVYLPAYARFDAWAGEAYRGRREVLAMADSLGIETIDLVPYFEEAADPRTLWAGPRSHLTPEGYQFMAEGIARGLRRSSSP